ncbi:hypothetical protein GEMRC1_005057 [Eukaryota sp. GEM-RC1]
MSFIHSGFLNKRGVSPTSWQRKFFVISASSHVDCWDSPEAFQKPGAIPKGRIACKGLSVVDTPAKTQKTFQFELQDGSKRPWILAADSAEDKEEWIDVIRSCVAECEGETDQQVTPEPETEHHSVPQDEVEDLNVPDLIKKIKTTKALPEKLEVLVSELSSVPNASITAHELVTVSSCFTNSDDRVASIELLSRHVDSLTVSDVASLIKKTPKTVGKMKVVEVCSPKLVYALPWDCEEIYKIFSSSGEKALVRELIASVPCSHAADSSIPTTEVLIKAVAACANDVEKGNIYRSWMSSVLNPLFSPEEFTKLLQKFTSVKQRLGSIGGDLKTNRNAKC